MSPGEVVGRVVGLWRARSVRPVALPAPRLPRPEPWDAPVVIRPLFMAVDNWDGPGSFDRFQMLSASEYAIRKSCRELDQAYESRMRDIRIRRMTD